MITVCMIVKDEEENIEKSLEAIYGYGFEIIVVDTGSRDKTYDIAKRYTENIYFYKWNNDFSQARNFSISKANNEYVLIIDADEVIVSVDKIALEGNLKNNKVGRIERRNIYYRNNEKYTYIERVNRLFNKNEFTYKGKVHEQIVSKKGNGYHTYNVPIVLTHSGYETDEINRKDKITRNIEILLQELKDNEGDPYILFQLGKSYYLRKEYGRSIEYFEKAMDNDLDPRLEYVQDMVESYGYALVNSNELGKALNLEGIYEEFSKSCDFVFLMGIIYMNNGLFSKAIEEFKKATTMNSGKMEGVNTYLANYNIGVIYECLDNKNLALEYYEKSNEYEKSLIRIKSLRNEM